MVTYGDYFSRRVLHFCGVSPDEILINEQESTHTGMRRTENIRLKISEIYQNLYQGFAKKNTMASKETFDNFQIERKIVASFYDSGILNNAERDYFQTQALQNSFEREQICVEEANPLYETIKTQKVEAQTKEPLKRKMNL